MKQRKVFRIIIDFFKGNIEDENLRIKYNEETKSLGLKMGAYACYFGIFFYLLFGILDIFVYPEKLAVIWRLRIIFILLLVIALSLKNTKFVKNNTMNLGAILMLLSGIFISAMCHVDGGATSIYYAGINLSNIFMIFILIIDVKRVALVCSLIYVYYMYPVFWGYAGNYEFSHLLTHNLFLISTIALCVLGTYYKNKLRLNQLKGRINLAHANEELQRIDQMKSQFFANVSHEVRTPLTLIIAPIQSLYQGDLGPVKEDQHQMHEKIYRNSLQLLDLINQMLDFAKIEAGKMFLRLEKIDICELLRDMVSVFDEVTERKGIKLRFSKEGKLPLICLDLDKVQRIMSNLLRNAIKFTASGFIYIRAHIENNHIVIDIEDTGIGISADQLPHIFERFKQVDPSTTRLHEGTGLGLTIVKESVDLMQGSISVESVERRGTRFRVTLPANLEEIVPDVLLERRGRDGRRCDEAPAESKDKRAKMRRRDDLAKVTLEDLAFIEGPVKQKNDIAKDDEFYQTNANRVLLIEDNDDLRSYLYKMLSKFGHKVIMAADGLEGWKLIQQAMPDIIVSDIMMPNMDGYGLLKEIREHHETRNIPVILITAKSEQDARIEGLGKGADEYLPKPIDVRELDARIRSLLRARHDQKIEALENIIDEKSMLLAQCTEMRDPTTAGHCKDVLNLGMIAANQMDIPIDRVFRESLLHHDIGKIKIPDGILLKEGKLTDEEYEVIKQHPSYGAELFGTQSGLEGVRENILAHQERFDGKGYPAGLQGEEIPLLARIIAVVDTYHVITHDRPYKKALGPKEAIKELLKFKGIQFDPRVVDAFIKGLLEENIITQSDIYPT